MRPTRQFLESPHLLLLVIGSGSLEPVQRRLERPPGPHRRREFCSPLFYGSLFCGTFPRIPPPFPQSCVADHGLCPGWNDNCRVYWFPLGSNRFRGPFSGLLTLASAPYFGVSVHFGYRKVHSRIGLGGAFCGSYRNFTGCRDYGTGTALRRDPWPDLLGISAGRPRRTTYRAPVFRCISSPNAGIWAACHVSARPVSYTFYRFECAIRAAAILSFVGIQGMVYEIQISLGDLLFSQVWTLLLVLLAIVALVDFWSERIRRSLLTS